MGIFWVVLNSYNYNILGLPGEVGPTGDKGPDGDEGEMGDVGFPGKAGFPGYYYNLAIIQKF